VLTPERKDNFDLSRPCSFSAKIECGLTYARTVVVLFYDRCRAPAMPRARAPQPTTGCWFMQVDSNLPMRSATGAGLLHFAASSLPLSRTAQQLKGPVLRGGQTGHSTVKLPHSLILRAERMLQRNDLSISDVVKPGVARATAERAQGVGAETGGHGPCRWSIDLIVGADKRWRKPTSLLVARDQRRPVGGRGERILDSPEPITEVSDEQTSRHLRAGLLGSGQKENHTIASQYGSADRSTRRAHEYMRAAGMDLPRRRL